MTSIAQKLSDIVGVAFESEGLPRELGAVRVSDRPDLAQFQCNGAMAAAKQARKNPRDVAQNIVEYLTTHYYHSDEGQNLSIKDPDLRRDDVFSVVEIAGPGFINLNVTDAYIQNHLQNLQNFGVEPTQEDKNIILDYGGPNVAKPLHVGHLRSAVIGSSLRNIMKFKGYEVLGDIHLGDWGTQMGMLINDYLKNGEQDIVLNTNLDEANEITKLMDDFSVRYPKASAASKEDPILLQEARDATVKLQDKEEPYYSIWQKIRDVSVADMKITYDELGVVFDLWQGEAGVHDYIDPMVQEMQEHGIAQDSNGAVVVFVDSADDGKEIPPLILKKSDGAVMYGTTDCATIVERMKLYNPAKIVYVVDQRQALHFEQVFRAARKANIAPDSVELTHAGFGTMNGLDGKPFKTRTGGVMPLSDFISMAKEKARARLSEANLADDLSDDEFLDITNKVAIAAIKFADLQNQRQADYVFDLDRLISFEGKTGPYVMYQAVRIKSILTKAKAQNFAVEGDLLIDDKDRGLALLLAQFPDVLDLSIASYAPHHLCEYVYKVAQAFSSFYGNCHILSESDENIRTSRLALCSKTVDQLEQVLNILGIDVPDRM